MPAQAIFPDREVFALQGNELSLISRTGNFVCIGQGVSTHYVVLAHRLRLVGADPVVTPDDQHEALRWFSVVDLLGRDDVHPYTKAYFRSVAG